MCPSYSGCDTSQDSIEGRRSRYLRKANMPYRMMNQPLIPPSFIVSILHVLEIGRSDRV